MSRLRSITEHVLLLMHCPFVTLIGLKQLGIVYEVVIVLFMDVRVLWLNVICRLPRRLMVTNYTVVRG